MPEGGHIDPPPGYNSPQPRWPLAPSALPRYQVALLSRPSLSRPLPRYQNPAGALCLGTNGDPRGVSNSYEGGNPVTEIPSSFQTPHSRSGVDSLGGQLFSRKKKISEQSKLQTLNAKKIRSSKANPAHRSPPSLPQTPIPSRTFSARKAPAAAAPALIASAFLRGRKLKQSGPRPNTPVRPDASETRPGRAIPADRTSDGDAKCELGLNASAQFTSASSQTRLERPGVKEPLKNFPIVGSVYGNKPRGSLKVLSL